MARASGDYDAAGQPTEPEHGWVVQAMRAGYIARAIVFGLIGYMALDAALHGGRPPGAQEALTQLSGETLGTPLLWAIAGGALGFAIWCLLAGLLDLDRRGRTPGGLFARFDFVATGLLYLAIAVVVAGLAATGVIGGSDEETRERGTALLLSLPHGGWVVIAVGMGFVVAGLWFGYKGLAGKYRERLRDTPVVEWLDPVCKLGWTSYGVVVIILGGFLLWAGWTLNASHAGGFAEAFTLVRGAEFGRLGLGVLGFGFMAFAVECLVEAAFRIVPAVHGTHAPNLATRHAETKRARAEKKHARAEAKAARRRG